MRVLYFLLSIFIFFGISKCDDFNVSEVQIELPSDDALLSLCIKNMVHKINHFGKFITDIILMNIESKYIQDLHGIENARFISRSFYWPTNVVYNRIYVIKSQNFSELETGLEKAKNDIYFSPSAKFIIVIEQFIENVENVTGFLVLNNIYNVTIIANVDDVYVIYTYESPIVPCNRREKLVQVSTCTSYDFDSFQFPVINSIRDCNFRFLTHNHFPLVDMDDKENPGFEQKMMEFFSDYSEAKIEVYAFAKIDKLGQVANNYMTTDALDKVANNDFEGAFGGYYLRKVEWGKFSFTYPFLVDHLRVVLARADYLDTLHALFHRATSAFVWIFAVMIIFTVIVHTLKLFPCGKPDITRDFLMVYGYFLNRTTIKRYKKGFTETVFLATLFFAIFMLPFAIQAYMVSIQTNPVRGYEPQKIEEVLPDHTLVTMRGIRSSDPGVRGHKNCSYRLECLTMIKNCKDKDHFTFLSDTLYDVYKWMLVDEDCELDFYRVDEIYTMSLRTVFLRHGSVLLEPFQKFMYLVMGAGLIDHHFEEMVYKERIKCKPKTEPFHVLKLEDMTAPVVMLLTGYVLSTLCFGYECVS